MTIDPTEPRPPLSFNLTHNEKIDLRIEKLQIRNERNSRLDLLRDSLNLQRATKDLESLMKKGLLQESGTGTATANSSSVAGLVAGDEDLPIDQVAALSGISSGDIFVNGTKVTIDITTDSIEDVIANIESKVPSVEANYDSASNTFEITSSEDLLLSNGNSLFFSGLNTETGSISNGTSEGKINFFSTDKFKNAIKRFATSLNKVIAKTKELDHYLEEDSENFVENIQDAVKNAYKNTLNEDFEGIGKARLGMGISFDFDNEEFALFDSKTYKSKMPSNVDQMTSFFLDQMNPKDDESGGLFDQFNSALTQYNTFLKDDIASLVPSTGTLVNFEA